MELLKSQIKNHRIVLHITDITLMEIERQIRERVLARRREIKDIEKDLSHWRVAAPNILKAPNDFDAEELSSILYRRILRFITVDCGAEHHQALNAKPHNVFRNYFERKPPFDGEDSKEFPDGFVIESILEWCKNNNNSIYIVTADKAMLRAAHAEEFLHSIKDIHELLARAAADLGSDGESSAESALYGQDFDGSFLKIMRDAIPELAFVYAGDLAEGEAYEGKLISIEEINDWTVVGLNENCVDVILTAVISVRVEIQYEDRDDAIYDKEDGYWFGAESASTTVEDEIEVEILVEILRESGLVRNGTLLTQEAYIN